MKKLSLLLLLGILACKSEFNASSRRCFEKNQKQLLVKAVELFDARVQQRYADLSLEAAYFRFLFDWSSKKIPQDFFRDSLQLKIRNLDLWTVTDRSEKNMDLEKQLFNVDSMNPKSVKLNPEIATCLARAIDWRKGISSFLLLNSKYRISPKIVQKRLYHSSENDLKQFENRLAIVLAVYYQTTFNLNDIDALTGPNP